MFNKNRAVIFAMKPKSKSPNSPRISYAWKARKLGKLLAAQKKKQFDAITASKRSPGEALIEKRIANYRQRLDGLTLMQIMAEEVPNPFRIQSGKVRVSFTQLLGYYPQKRTYDARDTAFAKRALQRAGITKARAIEIVLKRTRDILVSNKPYFEMLAKGRITVKELKPDMPVPEITLEITSIGEPMPFRNKTGQGIVRTCSGKDATGEVNITLWNKDTDRVKKGDTVRITSGWCTNFKGKLQISTSLSGSLAVNPK